MIVDKAEFGSPLGDEALSLEYISYDERSDSDGDHHAELQRAFANPHAALNEAAIVATTDARGTIISVNQKFCDISGYSEGELIGQNHRLLKSGAHPPAFFADLYRTISQGKTWHGTICNRAKNGQHYWVDTTIVPNFGIHAKIIGYTAIRFDVTPLKLARQDLWTHAHFDELTGAANRRHFFAELTKRVNRKSDASFFLVMLDLDHFKDINDDGGHVAGDALLVQTSDILRSYLHPNEHYGRLGGDEFAMILEVSDGIAGLDLRLRSILRDIQNIPFPDHSTSHCTASIGVVRSPNDGITSKDLTRRADLSLYAAKKSGGNDWRAFTPLMEDAEARKEELRSRFHKALLNGNIQLYYQPVVTILAGTPPSFEALLRWIDEDGVARTPGSFMELFDFDSVSREVGRLALKCAIAQIEDWNAKGLTFSMIAVNATSPDLRSEAFVADILEAIDNKRISPSQLCVEITEGMLLDRQAHRVRAAIDRLHHAGVRIAFDDFGTGFASLTHLRELPINFVKIDRSFIQNLCSEPKDRVIVESIISLAHRLRLGVVAEGVEDDNQRNLLANFGCDRIQGYAVAPALPADQAEKFLRGRITD